MKDGLTYICPSESDNDRRCRAGKLLDLLGGIGGKNSSTSMEGVR